MVTVGSTGSAMKKRKRKKKTPNFATPQRDFVNRNEGCVNIVPVVFLVGTLGTQQEEITVDNPQSTKEFFPKGVEVE